MSHCIVNMNIHSEILAAVNAGYVYECTIEAPSSDPTPKDAMFFSSLPDCKQAWRAKKLQHGDLVKVAKWSGLGSDITKYSQNIVFSMTV